MVEKKKWDNMIGGTTALVKKGCKVVFYIYA